MRILLLSDVHGNLSALNQILDNIAYDEVLFMGDVVDYGPFPFEVHSRLMQIEAKRVVGNHDVAAALGVDCGSTPNLRDASEHTRERITRVSMSKTSMRSLIKAERTLRLQQGGLRIMMVHASPRDELYEYISKDYASKLEVPGVDFLLLGHTHIPYAVRAGRTIVVNPGSVGMPFDGNPKASYAILDTGKGRVRFGRMKYDIEVTIAKLHELIGDDKPVFRQLASTLRTGTIAIASSKPVRSTTAVRTRIQPERSG